MTAQPVYNPLLLLMGMFSASEDETGRRDINRPGRKYPGGKIGRYPQTRVPEALTAKATIPFRLAKPIG